MTSTSGPEREPRGPIVSFVIPAHNSASVIEDTLEAVAKRLADLPAEILVVENGSTDGTQDLLAALAHTWPADAPTLRVLTAERGLGHAVRTGLAHCRGRVVIITADDLPFGFDDLDAAERLGLHLGTLVIGSKAHPGSVTSRSLLRTVLSGGLRAMRWTILGMRTADPQGSLVLDGEWARTVLPALREPGFLVTTEIVYAADLAGVEVVEVPVRLRESNHRTRIRVSDVYHMAVGLVGLRGRRKNLRTVGSVAMRGAARTGDLAADRRPR